MKHQKLIEAEKSLDDRIEYKNALKVLYTNFTPGSTAANRIDQLITQDTLGSTARQEYRKALQKIIDIPKKFGNPDPPQAQYDPSSDIAELAKDLDELRRDLDLIKASETTAVCADKLRRLEERVTRIHEAKDETFDDLRKSYSESSVASRDNIVPPSYSGGRRVIEHHAKLEQLFPKRNEKSQTLEDLRKDMARVSSVVEELNSEKTSLLTERRELLEVTLLASLILFLYLSRLVCSVRSGCYW